MICPYCSLEFDENLFSKCPFCLSKFSDSNDEAESVPLIEDFDDLFMDDTEASADSRSLRNENIIASGMIMDFDGIEIDYGGRDISTRNTRSYSLEDSFQKIDIMLTDNPLTLSECFPENGFSLFLQHCAAKSFTYMHQLLDFDLDNLIQWRGMGYKRIAAVKRRYEIFRPYLLSMDTNVLPSDRINIISSEGLIDGSFSVHQDFLKKSIFDFSFIGLNQSSEQKLRDAGITVFEDLTSISRSKLQALLSPTQYLKLIKSNEILSLPLETAFSEFLEKQRNSEAFQLVIKRQQGYTLDQLGRELGLTKERVRQKVNKFLNKITPFAKPVIRRILHDFNSVKIADILEVFEDSGFNLILLRWCYEKAPKFFDLQFLDYVQAFVPRKPDPSAISLSIIPDFIGDGIDLDDRLSDLVDLLYETGYTYMDEMTVRNLINHIGYQQFGRYVMPKNGSYVRFLLPIIKKRFPQGIKLYGDSDDLEELRWAAYQTFGSGIDLPDDNRALSVRLCSYLVLCGRGKYTLRENVQIDTFILEDIKHYIDHSSEEHIYYSTIFSEFEGMLRMMSNIDNRDFLHGILMLYFPDSYQYTRDYLIKFGNNLSHMTFVEKCKDYIHKADRFVSGNELKQNISGLTDGMLASFYQTDSDLFIADRQGFGTLTMQAINEDAAEFLKTMLERTIADNNGLTTDALLFEAIEKNNAPFIKIHRITSAYNAANICQKLFKDRYDFRHPMIIRKGLLHNNVRSSEAIQYAMGYPDSFVYSDYSRLIQKLKLPSISSSCVLKELMEEYTRISRDIYIKKELLSGFEQEMEIVKQLLFSQMAQNLIALTMVDYKDFPSVYSEWNEFLLASMIDLYIDEFTIIQPTLTDRRWQRGIVVKKEIGLKTFDETVVYFLKQKGIQKIPESQLLPMMIMNGFCNTILRNDFYQSDLLHYENGMFTIINRVKRKQILN